MGEEGSDRLLLMHKVPPARWCRDRRSGRQAAAAVAAGVLGVAAEEVWRRRARLSTQQTAAGASEHRGDSSLGPLISIGRSMSRTPIGLLVAKSSKT